MYPLMKFIWNPDLQLLPGVTSVERNGLPKAQATRIKRGCP